MAQITNLVFNAQTLAVVVQRFLAFYGQQIPAGDEEKATVCAYLAFAEVLGQAQMSEAAGGAVPTMWVAEVTGAYQASAGEIVPYDASGGTFTITLPEDPVVGDCVMVVENAGNATAITVASGDPVRVVQEVDGSYSGSSATLGVANGRATYSYQGNETWVLIALTDL